MPAPDRPVRQTNSPRVISRSTPLRIWRTLSCRPKARCTPVKRTSGSVVIGTLCGSRGKLWILKTGNDRETASDGRGSRNTTAISRWDLERARSYGHGHGTPCPYIERFSRSIPGSSSVVVRSFKPAPTEKSTGGGEPLGIYPTVGARRAVPVSRYMGSEKRAVSPIMP